MSLSFSAFFHSGRGPSVFHVKYEIILERNVSFFDFASEEVEAVAFETLLVAGRYERAKSYSGTDHSLHSVIESG